MPDLNLVVLYVENPAASATFYGKLLEREPVGSFPTYVAFALGGGLTLGLWANHRVEPPPPRIGNRGELAFMVENEDAVRALYQRWSEHGVRIEKPPFKDVFGLTFVALDPDGHRIRVCLPDK